MSPLTYVAASPKQPPCLHVLLQQPEGPRGCPGGSSFSPWYRLYCPGELVGARCRLGTRRKALLNRGSRLGGPQVPMALSQAYPISGGHSGRCGDIPPCPTYPSPAGRHLKTICLFCPVGSKCSKISKILLKIPLWSRPALRQSRQSWCAAVPSPPAGPCRGHIHPCPALHAPSPALGSTRHPLRRIIWGLLEDRRLITDTEVHHYPETAAGLWGFDFCKRSF